MMYECFVALPGCCAPAQIAGAPLVSRNVLPRSSLVSIKQARSVLRMSAGGATSNDETIISPFAKERQGASSPVSAPASDSTSTSTSTSTSDSTLPLTSENVRMVLEEVRPFLQSDGGDVSLQAIDRYGNIKLILEGACGSCSSSQTTMQLGIEKKLRERFGSQVGDVEAVEDPSLESLRQGIITAPMVDKILSEVRPAVMAMGGRVEVEMVQGNVVSLSYSGPPRLSKGVEMLLKDRIPKVEKVVFFPFDESDDEDEASQ
eukprot:CAMPEP_0184696592 /NCGR_PEP_ID=MMETSP0313-20130426/3829_1 /TAXON_ID=2792 /ORGANISM="Porphyridium aerugineum, Strain SAG 1380-2" /LENGTH=260 /DNA_ID=CAMNT_0027155241 /DNA_START=45 /DNA_END=827 /DNA_ORIENTATION=-